MNVKVRSFGQIFLALILSVLIVVPASTTISATWAAPDDNQEQPGDDNNGDDNNDDNNNQGGSGSGSGDSGESISFYGMSSAASNYLDSVAFKQGNFNSVFGTPVTVAAAGMGLGYVDLSELSNSPTVSQGPLWSTKSHNAQTYAYEGLSRVGDSDKSSNMVMSNAMQGYAYYGTLLTELGFAETAMQGDSVSLYRTVTGFLLQGSYWLASTMNDVLGGIIDGLQMLNPFQLFVNATGSNSNGSDAGATIRDRIYGIMTNGNGTVGGVDWGDNHVDNGTGLVGSDLAKNVQSIYNTLVGFAQTFAIPMFLAILVIGFVFFGMDRRGGSKSNGSRVKHFLVRFLFIMLGIPLLGYCYTFSLDALSANFNSSTQPDRIVAQTLVDFEGWVTNDNLDASLIRGSKDKLNAVATWDGDVLASVLPLDRDNVRHYALNINKGNSALAKTGTRTVKDTNFNVFEGEESDGSSSYYVVDNKTKWKSDGIVALINRYATGDRFTSANYEAKRVADFDLVGADGASIFGAGVSIGDKVKDLETQLNDSTAFGDPASTDPSEVNNGLLTSGLVTSSTGVGYVNNMSVLGSTNKPLSVAITSGPGRNQYTFSYSQGKLTDLATYNFLNTKFDSTSMTVYSPSSSVNDQSHIAYYSVTQAGTGLYGTLLMANSIAMLLSLVIIGLVYGVGLLFSNLKSAIGLIASMPLAAFGALSAIARLIGLVLVMIAEVLLTIILYDVVASFLGSFNSAILGFLPAMMSNSSSNLLAPVSCIAGLLFLVMFIIMALKVRKSVLSAVSDGITGVVKKLTDADPKLPNAEGGKGFMQSAMGAMRTARMMGVGQGTMGTMVKDAALVGGIGTTAAMGYGMSQMMGAGGADMSSGLVAGEDAADPTGVLDRTGGIDSSRDAQAQSDFAEKQDDREQQQNVRPTMENSREASSRVAGDTNNEHQNDVDNATTYGDTAVQANMNDADVRDVMPTSDTADAVATEEGRADTAYSAQMASEKPLYETMQAASPEASMLRADQNNPDVMADASGRADMGTAPDMTQQAMYEGDTIGYENAAEARAAGLAAQPADMYETSAAGSAQFANYTPEGSVAYGGDASQYQDGRSTSGLVANNESAAYTTSELGGAVNSEDLYAPTEESMKSIDASSFNESNYAEGANVAHGLDVENTSTGEASLSESIQNAGVPLYGQAAEGGRQIETSRSMVRERVGESTPERVALGQTERSFGTPGSIAGRVANAASTPSGAGAARSLTGISGATSPAMESSRIAGAGSAAHQNASNAFAARVQGGMPSRATTPNSVVAPVTTPTGTSLGDTMNRMGSSEAPRRIESIPSRVADIPRRESGK